MARAPRGASATARTASAGQLARSLERLTRIVERLSADVDQLREQVQDDQRVEMQRVGQLQAELDAVKKAWEKMHGV
jgi:outer membrane murein-binding lipoprotein Lpp